MNVTARVFLLSAVIVTYSSIMGMQINDPLKLQIRSEKIIRFVGTSAFFSMGWLALDTYCYLVSRDARLGGIASIWVPAAYFVMSGFTWKAISRSIKKLEEKLNK